MNKINFNQSGGFPLEQKTLMNMQNAYFEVLKTMLGHFGLPSSGNFIIYGCEVNNNTITSGMLYINGDLCYFNEAAGNLLSKIKKIETVEEAPFENGDNIPVYTDYSAAINDGGVVLSEFERLPKVHELVNQIVNWSDIENKPAVVIDPANLTTTPPEKTVLERIQELEKKTSVFISNGVVFPWRKKISEIPQGWQEVTDLRGRTVFGMDITIDPITGSYINPEFAPLTTGSNDPGRVGGNKTKTLSITEIPPHTHEVPVFANGSASGNADGHPDNYIDMSRRVNSFSTGGLPDGSTKSFSILNPYKTVIFIEYIG